MLPEVGCGYYVKRDHRFSMLCLLALVEITFEKQSCLKRELFLVVSNVEKEIKIRNQGSGDCLIELNPLSQVPIEKTITKGKKIEVKSSFSGSWRLEVSVKSKLLRLRPLAQSLPSKSARYGIIVCTSFGPSYKVRCDFGVVLSWTSIGQES